MEFLTSDQVEQIQDLPFEDMDVPGWGGKVRVIGLNGEAAQEYTNKLVKLKPDGTIENINSSTVMIDLLVATLANDKFELLFNSPKGRQILGKKSAAILVGSTSRLLHAINQCVDFGIRVVSPITPVSRLAIHIVNAVGNKGGANNG